MYTKPPPTPPQRPLTTPTKHLGHRPRSNDRHTQRLIPKHHNPLVIRRILGPDRPKMVPRIGRRVGSEGDPKGWNIARRQSVTFPTLQGKQKERTYPASQNSSATGTRSSCRGRGGACQRPWGCRLFCPAVNNLFSVLEKKKGRGGGAHSCASRPSAAAA